MFDDTKAYMPTSNLSSLVYTKYRIYLEYISMLTYFRIVLEKYLKHMISKWNDPNKKVAFNFNFTYWILNSTCIKI